MTLYVECEDVSFACPRSPPTLKDLRLLTGAGEVYCLLGPNGAGKTTLIGALLGDLRPQAGRVSVLGASPYRAPLALKRRVGIIPQKIGLFDTFSVAEHLQSRAARSGPPAPAPAAQGFGKPSAAG